MSHIIGGGLMMPAELPAMKRVCFEEEEIGAVVETCTVPWLGGAET
jgi:hypothetical protein